MKKRNTIRSYWQTRFNCESATFGRTPKLTRLDKIEMPNKRLLQNDNRKVSAGLSYCFRQGCMPQQFSLVVGQPLSRRRQFPLGLFAQHWPHF